MPIRSRLMFLISPQGTPKNNRGFLGGHRRREVEESNVGKFVEGENAGRALLPEQPEAMAQAAIEYPGKE